MWNQYRTDVETALKSVSGESIQKVVDILTRVRSQSAAVYLVGNGGSAATCAHFANDLVKMGGIRAFSLPAMIPLVTAYGNDYEWKEMFSRALKDLLLPYDAVMGISCSGDSPNVVEALMMARHYRLPGIRTIGLIGSNLACKVGQVGPDVLVSVPWRDIKVQEDCHMVICHAIAGELRATSQAAGVL